MSKESLIWLIVRLVGCIFGYWAVTSSIAFVGSLFLAMQTPGFKQFFVVVFGNIVYVALYWIAANYLIRDGRLLFDILNTEEPAKAQQPVIETSLNLEDDDK